MAGHSKWATTHRKKGLIDAKRGKIFQKIAREIQVAAKGTNGVPEENPALRVVIEKARANNMPKENIDKAIAKALGVGNAEDYESITYEAYGPSGVAIMIDCLSDNRNRTAMLVRSNLTKHGGNLGTNGSVGYLFNRKGIIVVDKKLSEDKVLETVLEAGAIDFIVNEDNYEIYTNPEDLIQVKESLENLGIEEFITSEVSFVPDNYVELIEEEKEKVINLIDVLEEIDDVQNVYHNLSF